MPGLSADNFELREDGKPQKISLLDLDALPVDVTVLFDVSGSVSGPAIRHLIDAGQRLMDELRPEDRMSLLTFADRVRLIFPATADRTRARAALATLTTGGRTSLRDGALPACCSSRRRGAER